MIDGKTLPTISATRVALRWLTEEDVPAIFEIFSNEEVTRYWSTPPMESIAKARELIDEVGRLFASKILFEWGVVRKSDDRVIGTCTLAGVDKRNRRAEIGFALARDHWGVGYISEALEALLSFAFTEMNLHRIEADVDPGNAPSIRTLERLGFQREGYLRERWFIGGEIHDTVFYGLLAREFASREDRTGSRASRDDAAH